MSNLIAEFEARVASGIDDFRRFLAEHEASVDRAAEDVKTAALSTIGQALEAAVHVEPGFVVAMINAAEAEFARLAGEPPAPAPAPAPATGEPVVGGVLSAN